MRRIDTVGRIKRIILRILPDPSAQRILFLFAFVDLAKLELIRRLLRLSVNIRHIRSDTVLRGVTVLFG